MDPMNEAAAGGREETSIAVVSVPAGEASLSARAAARNLAEWRHNKEKQQGHGPARTNEEDRDNLSAAPEEGADDTVAGGREARTDETSSIDDNEPRPVDSPSGWSDEDKSMFANLPRAVQERLAERERSRASELTEQRKALEADRAKLDEARQQYEATLPQLLASLQGQQANEFSDIKTPADIERLAREDQPRYAKWNLHQQQVAEVTRQILGAQARLASEQQQRFADFAKRQDDLFKEKVPQMADPAEVAKLQSGAMAVLKDHGFEEAELAASWHGQKDFSLRDHRVQLLIRDAILWREAKAKAKAAVAKPLPPVQRPGTSRPKGAAQEEVIQNLTKKLDASGSLKDAAALIKARRAAR